jgi:hypothetical protein
MRSDDLQADNVFSRLISYTPRIAETGNKRTALEDFYTEALAWCLRNSQEFREAIFELLNQADPDLPRWKQESLTIDVHTQLGFNASLDDSDENEESRSGKRRFDLVIQSSPSKDFVLVFENKVRWSFTDDQIPAYLAELRQGDRFKNFKTKRLFLISPSGKKPSDDVVPLRWSSVQQALAGVGGVDLSKNCGPENKSATQFICNQLAGFLRSKGLTPMCIPKINGETLAAQLQGIKLRESLAKMLQNIRDEHGKHRLGKEVTFDQDDDGSLWLGLYNRNGAYFYLGFKLATTKGTSDVDMIIQFETPNSRSKERVSKLGAEEKDGCLEFSQKISGTEFDGNADKIRGWFEEKLSSTRLLAQ